MDTTKNHFGKDTNIVVTRFDEGLSWIKPYLEYCIIYNKGKDDLPYSYIKLPNIGLEHHSWVYHIVNNYETLPDYLIFLQGSPQYHFIGSIEKFLEQFLNQETRHKIKIEDPHYIPLTDWYVTENVKGEEEVYETYIQLFEKEPPFQKFEYATCGQFCVSSDRIKHYSKNFYQKYLSIFESKENNGKRRHNPAIDYAYTAERMWSILYSQKYLIL